MKAIFLDRDGTLNFDAGYTYKVEELQLLHGVKEGLLELKKKGFILIVITNQSGIGRGYYTLNDFERFMDAMQCELGIIFDDILYCPHTPEEKCPCRKPSSLLIEQSIKKFGLIKENCYFIGDKEVDILAGKNAGINTVYIGNEIISTIPHFHVSTILEFSQKIG